jgi:hypothetical protein
VEWKEHVLARLRRQIEESADQTLMELSSELAGYAVAGDPAHATPGQRPQHNAVFVPLTLRTPAGVLSFLSTTTIFGTPVDVTLSEIAIEAFFPADAETARLLRGSLVLRS